MNADRSRRTFLLGGLATGAVLLAGKTFLHPSAAHAATEAVTLDVCVNMTFSPDTKVGFLAIANKFQAMIDSGNIPPQYTESQLAQLVFNNRLDAGLTIFFMIVVVVLALFSIKTALAALKEDKPTAKETPYEPMPENLDAIETQAKGAH